MVISTKTTLDLVTARTISPTAVVVLLAWIAAGGVLAVSEPLRGPATFAFVLVGWVLSVMAHEFGHAFVAFKAGDHTVAAKGYLTLDPLKYMDSVTSLIIPLIVLAIGGIGFPGGAVYLRPDLMRGRLWRSAASLAGPAATLLALVALGLAAGAARSFSPSTALPNALALLAFLQATALVLNLLPIPGLDGYGALRPFLPGGVTRGLRRLEGVIFIGFVVLLLSSNQLSRELFGLGTGLTAALGVPLDAIGGGYDAFRFWK